MSLRQKEKSIGEALTAMEDEKASGADKEALNAQLKEVYAKLQEIDADKASSRYALL